MSDSGTPELILHIGLEEGGLSITKVQTPGLRNPLSGSYIPIPMEGVDSSVVPLVEDSGATRDTYKYVFKYKFIAPAGTVAREAEGYCFFVTKFDKQRSKYPKRPQDDFELGDRGIGAEVQKFTIASLPSVNDVKTLEVTFANKIPDNTSIVAVIVITSTAGDEYIGIASPKLNLT